MSENTKAVSKISIGEGMVLDPEGFKIRTEDEDGWAIVASRRQLLDMLLQGEVPEGSPSRVVIESPYGGACEQVVNDNVAYAVKCMQDSLARGEYPMASHILYASSKVLDDNDENERALGMEAGFAWGVVADKTVVYMDMGMSEGMAEGITRAQEDNREVEYRYLYAKGGDPDVD